jgi:hypothetical protein
MLDLVFAPIVMRLPAIALNIGYQLSNLFDHSSIETLKVLVHIEIGV